MINCSLIEDDLSCKFTLAHAVIISDDMSKHLET